MSGELHAVEFQSRHELFLDFLKVPSAPETNIKEIILIRPLSLLSAYVSIHSSLPFKYLKTQPKLLTTSLK